MSPLSISLCVIVTLLCCSSLAFAADDVRFPDDAGYADVTKPPYNAVADGVSDCTEALQAALDRSRLVYLPNGTYLVSGTLNWGMKEASAKRKVLQGQSRDGVVIKLKDAAPDFDQPRRPKEVIRMASRGDLDGAANAFRNGLYDLTIHVGKQNPGAVGVLLYAHNQGGARNLRVVAEPDGGLVGIDLYRGLSGPLLAKNITVEGFEYGIRVGGSVRQITFSEVRLSGQRKYGLYNDNNVLAIEDLTSDNAVPAVHNRAGWGFITLVNAKLTGGSPGGSAIENVNGQVFLRNIATSGYEWALSDGGKPFGGDSIDEYASGGARTLFRSTNKSLNLPILKTPEVAFDPVDQWVPVTRYKPTTVQYVTPKGQKRSFEDWSSAIQQAIDSGATTIYFPKLPENQKYTLAATVLIRGNVRRIFGGEQALTFRLPADQPAFRVVDGDAPAVVLERFEVAYGSSEFGVEVDTERTFILRNAILGQIKTTPKPGLVFVEDVSGGPLKFEKKTVVARMLDPENSGPKITNIGGRLWLLGVKIEHPGPVLVSRNSESEILGGLIYMNGGRQTMPMVETEDARVSVSLAACCHNGLPFETILSETRQGVTQTNRREDFVRRDGWGLFLPLYVAGPGDLPPQTPRFAEPQLICDLRFEPVPPATTQPARQTPESRVQVSKNLQVGEIFMVDRQFTVSWLPDEVKGSDFVRVSGELARQKGDSRITSMAFRVSADAIVYCSSPLEGWEPVGKPFKWIYSFNTPAQSPPWPSVAEKETNLFRKQFPAKSIVQVPVDVTFLAARKLPASR